MLKLAVTGGIGSGKTTVCKYFEYIDISVYYSDYQAKVLMNTDQALQNKLIAEFGADCYIDGVLNREFLSKKVFSNKESLTKLNAIVHPAVLEDFNQWAESQTSKYVIIESAILFDIGWEKHVDKVLCVVADEQIRIERTIKRDRTTRENVERIISNQMGDKIKIEKSDYVVLCDDKKLLIKQINIIDKSLRDISICQSLLSK